jgi:hypothetical protein
MKRNYFVLSAFFLFSSYSFSQSTKTTAVLPLKTQDTISTKPSKNLISNLPANSGPVFQKNAFPADQKLAPAVFYVKNDKPAERSEYMQGLQSESSKK